MIRPPFLPPGATRDVVIEDLWRRGRDTVEIAAALDDEPAAIANRLAQLRDQRHAARGSPAHHDGTPTHRFDMPGPLP